MAIAAQQTTLARPVTRQGIGLHTGSEGSVTLLPAGANVGIVFVSESGVQIPAGVDWVVDTERATSLGRGEFVVRGAEHLLAALYALGVDNATIAVGGPEVPAGDGSAREWVALLRKVGRKRLGAPRRVYRLSESVWAARDDAWAAAMPAAELALGVAVEYMGTAAERQTLWLPLTGKRFAEELAPARTFCLQEEYQALLAAGLAQGGSLENAFVLGADGYSGPLRFPDEVVRHKALDLVGDLALCGCRFIGQVIAIRPSHRLNVELASKLRAALTTGSASQR